MSEPVTGLGFGSDGRDLYLGLGSRIQALDPATGRRWELPDTPATGDILSIAGIVSAAG